MYAIIEACGRQYKVEEGTTVFFEKLGEEEGKKVSFDKVVLVSNDGKVEVGAPYVFGAKVEGKVVSNGRGKKILVEGSIHLKFTQEETNSFTNEFFKNLSNSLKCNTINKDLTKEEIDLAAKLCADKYNMDKWNKLF